MSRLFLGFAALTLLAACGVQGDLERPDPMWNSQRAIQVECRREREHNEHLDRRCTPPAAQTAPVTPPQSPTAPESPATTTTTTTTP